MYIIKYNDSGTTIVLCRECFDKFIDSIEKIVKAKVPVGSFEVLHVEGDTCNDCNPVDRSVVVDVMINLN